jgi:Leucine Rich repeat
MEQEPHQPQQQPVHRSILDSIDHQIQNRLFIRLNESEGPIDRRSWQHLVDYLDDRDSHEVTELGLDYCRLCRPVDSGWNVLRNFFSRSNTTLTKVTFWNYFHFGNQQDASLLLAAFQGNRTVSELSIGKIVNIDGSALGSSLSGLLQNMTQLHRLVCCDVNLSDSVSAMQPGLRSKQTLKELCLSACQLDDEALCLLADALVGNTTIEIFNISWNHITSAGLPHIMRLIESMRLRKIDMEDNGDVFDN